MGPRHRFGNTRLQKTQGPNASMRTERGAIGEMTALEGPCFIGVRIGDSSFSFNIRRCPPMPLPPMCIRIGFTESTPQSIMYFPWIPITLVNRYFCNSAPRCQHSLNLQFGHLIIYSPPTLVLHYIFHLFSSTTSPCSLVTLFHHSCSASATLSLTFLRIYTQSFLSS